GEPDGEVNARIRDIPQVEAPREDEQRADHHFSGAGESHRFPVRGRRGRQEKEAQKVERHLMPKDEKDDMYETAKKYVQGAAGKVEKVAKDYWSAAKGVAAPFDSEVAGTKAAEQNVNEYKAVSDMYDK